MDLFFCSFNTLTYSEKKKQSGVRGGGKQGLEREREFQKCLDPSEVSETVSFELWGSCFLIDCCLAQTQYYKSEVKKGNKLK